jgi:hypothetical protein
VTAGAVLALAAATVVATASGGAAADTRAVAHAGFGPAALPYRNLEGISTVSANDAWAAGISQSGSGPYRTYVLHYNGSHWSHIATPNAGSGDNQLLDILGVGTGEVWAVGQSPARRGGLALHRTSTGWHIVATPAPLHGSVQLSSLSAISSDDVWAVGSIQGVETRTLTLHWNGSQWKRVASPNVGAKPQCALYSVDAISTSDVWAVGTSFDRGRPLTMHWNGTRWTVVPTPRPGGDGAAYFLQSVSSSSTSDVWVSGPIQYATKTASAGPRPSALVLHWNGTRWIDESSDATPAAGFVANSLASQVVSPGQVWAVGDRLFQNSDHSLAELRTSSGWHVRSSPVSAYIFAIGDMDSTAPDDIWADGLYQAGPKSATRAILMHWDGHSWTDIVI